MADRVVFLHLTDPHVSVAGVSHVRDDAKVHLPGVPAGTREEVLDLLFDRLSEYLATTKSQLDGVLFSGDAQSKGGPGGHERVYKWLLDRLSPLGITADRIVATPGNHDVPRDSEPSSRARYESFVKVWRDGGCIVPWLDGIDATPATDMNRHRLVAADGSWAVFPINTSNWSNVMSNLPEPLRGVWNKLPDAVAGSDKERAEKIGQQLQALARFDVARVSPEQLEMLRSIIGTAPAPKRGRQLRIVVMHHHVRAPSLREELKPFADISNLEQVRALLSGCGVDVVVHGHKHEHAVYYDHIYNDSEETSHRTLVVSGATFEPGREYDAMRLVTIRGLPHVPTVTIEALPLPRAGAAWRPRASVERRLWVQAAMTGDPVRIIHNAPVVLVGSDIDEVYARACEVASADAQRGILIVHLDLPDGSGGLPLPAAYPLPASTGGDARERWIRDLVHWWQLDRSQLEHRIPYIHGSRLRRYGGKINQIKRIIDLLRAKDSTRALAVLVDPFRDFNPNGDNEEFASFCLVEFRRCNMGMQSVVDAIAYYRAQEFARWWPINVAELRLLQQEIGHELGVLPGRITTIAGDARTIARSPTQVAMPIIDRWLDQAPERLHLLADALVHRSARGEEQQQVIVEWRQALAEFTSATDEYNSDGVPIAIEGIRTLAAYIRVAADATDTIAAEIAAKLRGLADHNETYEHTRRDLNDFRRWAPTTKRYVEELEQLTAACLGPPSASGPTTDRAR